MALVQSPKTSLKESFRFFKQQFRQYVNVEDLVSCNHIILIFSYLSKQIRVSFSDDTKEKKAHKQKKISYWLNYLKTSVSA